MQPRSVRPLLLSACACLWACGSSGFTGDCGPVLSSAECQIVRAQLGALDQTPLPDPTNRYGRWTGGGGQEKTDEDNAAALGQRLFFDRCLSGGHDTACVTCHDPQHALIDARQRELQVPVAVTQGGMTTTMLLPPIQDPAPEKVTQPPPMVQPQLDLNGTPLAYWDPMAMTWHGVTRRPQSSVSSQGKGYTTRNSPTLYNVAYGAAVPPADGARTAGVTWVPWDGRYDSVWALVADVFEFGATHRSNRAHVAYRVFQKHRGLYETTFQTTLPNFDQTDGMTPPSLLYPRDASPATSFNADWVNCWNGTGGGCKPDPMSGLAVFAPTKAVKQDINAVFAGAGKALSAYIRRLRSGNSAYDRWLRGDYSQAQACSAASPACPDGESCDPAMGRCAMSVPAQRGLRLFIGRAECILCHNGPNFTDWRFHNLGVPAADPEHRTAGSSLPAVPALGTAPDADCDHPGTAPAPACPDQGRWGWQNHLAGACDPPLDGQGMVERDSTGKLKTRACQKSDDLSCFATDLDPAKPYSDDTTRCLPFDPCNYTDPATCQAKGCTWYAGVNPMTDGARACVPRSDGADEGKFKTASLRNVARTWPYMHNGALYDYGPAQSGATTPDDPTPHLMRVVAFYNQGGGTPALGTRDPILHPLGLSPGEMADLVEFLKALTDESVAMGPLLTMPADLIDLSDCPP